MRGGFTRNRHERGAGRNDGKDRPYEAAEVVLKDRADKSRIYVHDFVSLLSLPGDLASSVSEFSVLPAGCVDSS